MSLSDLIANTFTSPGKSTKLFLFANGRLPLFKSYKTANDLILSPDEPFIVAQTRQIYLDLFDSYTLNAYYGEKVTTKLNEASADFIVELMKAYDVAWFSNFASDIMRVKELDNVEFDLKIKGIASVFKGQATNEALHQNVYKIHRLKIVDFFSKLHAFCVQGIKKMGAENIYYTALSRREKMLKKSSETPINPLLGHSFNTDKEAYFRNVLALADLRLMNPLGAVLITFFTSDKIRTIREFDAFCNSPLKVMRGQ